MNKHELYLKEFLSALEHLDEDTIDYMVSLIKKRIVKKHTVFFQADEVSNHMFFVSKGLVMQRYCDEECEKAVAFYFEGDFFTNYESFLTNAPSEFYFKTIEDSILLYWEKIDYQNFLLTHPKATLASHSFVSQLFYKEFKVKTRLLAYPTPKLYNYIIKYEPQIIQRVPLIYIAEYLGVTAEYLSRLRKKIKTN